MASYLGKLQFQTLRDTQFSHHLPTVSAMQRNAQRQNSNQPQQRETNSNNVIITLVCTVQLASTLLIFFYLPGRLILVDSFLHVPFRVVVFHLLLPLSHYLTCCGHYRASLTVLYNSTGILPYAILKHKTVFFSTLINSDNVI
jgi:hypothetical protein